MAKLRFEVKKFYLVPFVGPQSDSQYLLQSTISSQSYIFSKSN